VEDLLRFPAGAAPRILDLGAGTGLLAGRLLARWPRARLVLLDLSADMLDQARQRFAGREDQVDIRPADYLADPLGGPYDAVASALSIHHLPDADKRALFRRAFAALRP
jgi:tRNA (cmo5U34)-methyltransferase